MSKKNKAFHLNERELNGWGYALMGQKRAKDALEIFKLNVHLYPQSANAFDSLGEIYGEMGNTELALKNYEQSLKLNPLNKNADQQIRKLKLKN